MSSKFFNKKGPIVSHFADNFAFFKKKFKEKSTFEIYI
jgi:hypothetical protein